MIIVRNTFNAKPGQAGKLAGQIKDMAGVAKLRNSRVMTDLVGSFNQVVLEHEVDSAADFEETLGRYMSDPQMRDRAQGLFTLWTTGKRELFRVV